MYIDIEKTFAEVIRIASTGEGIDANITIAENEIRIAIDRFRGLEKSCQMCLEILAIAKSNIIAEKIRSDHD